MALSIGLLGSRAVVGAMCPQDESKPTATPVEQLRLLPGFKAELIYSVPTSEQGSWVSMTVDNKGRLIASDQGNKRLFRITPAPVGDADAETEVEQLTADISGAQGLLYAFDSLYVMVNGGPKSGFHRLRDTNGDDQFDEITHLRKIPGGGEHGPHAIVLSPDGDSLYVCGGNHTKIPDPEHSLVPRNWQEDQLLPRMWDARGHATGILAPGGWICETDPDGKEFTLVSSGYRNQYDIAFNSAGDLFTYDADMEWDIGSPWYRPTRVCHATAGSEFGWRSGTGKWPTSYPDSLPPVVDIGPGSPTGIAFGYGTNFPSKYENALYIADWSYGIIYAVHLTPDGASYTAEYEQFCSSAALQVADIVVNPHDGALYFVIGGRSTQSGIYRIYYDGDAKSIPAPPREAGAANAFAKLRRDLESRFGSESEQDMMFALQNLGHPDRFVRYAARIVLEHMPVDKWADQVLEQSQPEAVINGIVGLARCGNAEHQASAIEQLRKLEWNSLSSLQRVGLLRAYGLVMIRLGEPTEQTRNTIVDHLAKVYPCGVAELDRELCRLMVAVEAPETVAKTLSLLDRASAQEEQIHYALCLRALKSGWSIDQRREYLEWFNAAASLRGGNSFGGFLNKIREEAIAAIPEKGAETLKTLIDTKPAPIDVIAELKKRPLVKEWTVEDLLPAVEEKLHDRDFENGKRVFAEATCYKCHRFNQEGGIVGPDLTAAGRRFNKRNLVEALVEPSRVVSDQYQATVFITEDGRQIVGRVVNLSGNNYMVQEDMLNPGQLTNVNRNQIEDMQASTLSLMPAGLLDTFTEDEILDLIAYIRSGVEPDGPALKKN